MALKWIKKEIATSFGQKKIHSLVKYAGDPHPEGADEG